MTEFIQRFDVCFYPLIVWILLVLNRSAARMKPRATAVMGWSAATAFLIATAVGYRDFQPADGMALFAVLVCAGIIAGAAALAVFVICPLVMAVIDSARDGFRRRAEERRWIREKAVRDEEQKKQEEREERFRQEDRARELARLEWQRKNPPPPPPTREERAAEVKARHETTLRMIACAGLDELEDRAARDEAKKNYLRELDSIWKRS